MSSWHPSSALLVTGFVAFVVVLSWNWWRPVRPLGHGIVLTLVGAVALLNASLYRARADDAFITYRYARNLAEGNGPVFNVHERVEGYSNFLWMCVLAAWHAVLGVNVEDVARVLGVVAALAAVFATYWLALVLTDGARTVSAAAALLLASAGPFAAYSLSGLETPLFALLVVVLTVLVIQERVVAAGVVAALATMTRPDGLVFVAVAIVWLLERAVTREIRARQVLWFLGSFGALFIPWTVWRVAYYGHLVPNALAAKTGGLGVVDQLRAGLDYMNSVFLEGWPLLILAVAVVGVALLLGERLRFSPGERLILLELVTFVAFLIVAGGDWMPASRLFVPALPLLVGLLGSVWHHATTTVAEDRAARAFGALACVASLLLLAASFSFFNELPRIRLWRSQVEALAAQGDWFDATLPAHTSIATYANGALSDHAGVDKNVIDMLGLTDEHIARDGRRLHSRSVPVGYRAYDYRYVVSRRPEIVIFSPTGFAGGPSCAVRAPFAGNYVGTSFRFAPGNSTGSYVNLFVRIRSGGRTRQTIESAARSDAGLLAVELRVAGMTAMPRLCQAVRAERRAGGSMSADGKWEISMNTPMGAQAATLDLKEEGSTLTGTMSAAAAPGPLDVTDGTVDGNNLTWKAALTQPMPINLEFAATVDGDKISGNVKLGTFGDATFEGTRS